MKSLKLTTFLFILLFTFNFYGQTNEREINWGNEVLNDKDLSKREYKNSYLKYDFSPLWTKTENSSVFGFIGDDFQRLYMKILSAKKDKNRPGTYLVSGRSMVKNNVCDFTGTIVITKARVYKNMYWGVDDEYRNKGIKKQGIIIAEYNFQEDRTQKHVGVFEGVLFTAWYIDKTGEIKYDDIRIESDGYSNNQFVGTWKSYDSKTVKNANWGDHRIPLSGDLDGGAGGFSPIDKYLKFGWQTYRDAYFNNNNEKARQEEHREWWK